MAVPAVAQSVAGESAMPDIWSRIRSGYSLQGNKVDERRIDNQLDVFGNPQRFFDTMGSRASPYLHYIVGELEQRKMPLELALLPIVESGYNPRAVSPRNAAGLWQIMPRTGTRFGLYQNSWYDGRKDIVESTRAALDYLELLHERFNGDWYLALAAYNAGEGSVDRAINFNRRRGRPTDYWSLPLPAETCKYVPRLLALSRILELPSDHAVELNPIPDAQTFVPVKVREQINLRQAVIVAGMDSEQFFDLNPAYTNGFTPPNNGSTVLVPAAEKPNFVKALREQPRATAIYYETYRIRPGDTLAAIARRFHTSVDALRAANGLSSNHIRAGATLRLASGAAMARPTAPATALTRGQGAGIYVVRRGDNLWSIARRHGLGSHQLARANGIHPSARLLPGQRLRITRSSAVAEESSLAASTRGVASGGKHKVDYKVRRGDSLYRIAGRFKVALHEVKRWNGLSGLRPVIYPGQSLVLYLDKPLSNQG
jgi:membrane-bound lytic murein transglycosylase D